MPPGPPSDSPPAVATFDASSIGLSGAATAAEIAQRLSEQSDDDYVATGPAAITASVRPTGTITSIAIKARPQPNLGRCYRCSMVSKKEEGKPVPATTTRDGRGVCQGHAEEHDNAQKGRRDQP